VSREHVDLQLQTKGVKPADLRLAYFGHFLRNSAIGLAVRTRPCWLCLAGGSSE
jgi:hypothetical protein